MARSAENITYFDAAPNDHGIAYTRGAFRHMSGLNINDRRKIVEALAAMRANDAFDEPLTQSRLVRHLPNGLRFVFERHGSALTVLAITGGTTAAAFDHKDIRS